MTSGLRLPFIAIRTEAGSRHIGRPIKYYSGNIYRVRRPDGSEAVGRIYMQAVPNPQGPDTRPSRSERGVNSYPAAIKAAINTAVNAATEALERAIDAGDPDEQDAAWADLARAKSRQFEVERGA